jgi:hypothetical protein
MSTESRWADWSPARHGSSPGREPRWPRPQAESAQSRQCLVLRHLGAQSLLAGSDVRRAPAGHGWARAALSCATSEHASDGASVGTATGTSCSTSRTAQR